MVTPHMRKGKTIEQEDAPDEEGKTPDGEEADVEQENAGVDDEIQLEAAKVGEADVVKEALFPSSACSA